MWLIKSQYRIKASLWLPFKCVCVFYCTIAHSPIRSVSEWLLPFIYLFTLYYLSVDPCSLLSIPCYTALYSLSLSTPFVSIRLLEVIKRAEIDTLLTTDRFVFFLSALLTGRASTLSARADSSVAHRASLNHLRTDLHLHPK